MYMYGGGGLINNLMDCDDLVVFSPCSSCLRFVQVMEHSMSLILKNVLIIARIENQSKSFLCSSWQMKCYKL